MDSRTILDNALFQLTPTRTRCDLVIFGGGLSEKLASGLLEPFISHLKTAKDQISKGGYSITLRPLPPYSSWFTKATLQRFVRFVGTPEVLERFVTIEREIEQIESSVPSNEQLKGDYNGANDTAQEENSKVRLQRALETRRSVLRKEQAMAYARALVTGFDLDCINDLISFADAFGASRLREACVNFMELCKKKNQDRLWMDEIAAMQASRLELPFLGTSGITLASEEYPSQIGGLSGDSAASLGSVDLSQDNSLPASDGKAQVPAPWPNHLPQYMHNFQGPVFQQMPPYQGYVFPGMQVGSPYFPGNMQWSSNPDGGEHNDHRKHKSSSRNKKKSSRGKGREDSKQENSTEPSDTSTETESDENLQNGITQSSGEHARRKKYGKKSSRKVVIRNINYITSKRDGENGGLSEETSDEDDFIDGEALKHQVEEAVNSLDRQHKSNSRHRKKSHRSTIDSSNDATDQENKNVAANNLDSEKAKDQWGAFQSLLLNDKDTESFGLEPHTLPVQEEYFTMKSSQEGRSLDFSQETEGVRKQRTVSNDSFIATKGEPSNEGKSRIENFENGENLRKMVNKRDNTYEDLLFSHRSGESGKYRRPTVSEYSSESPMIRSQKEGDWFVSSQLCQSENKDESMDSKMFDGDYVSTVNGNKKDSLADDSFMIQTRAFMDDQPDLQLRMDISMVAEVIEATQYENGTTAASTDQVDAFNAHEPDDLYMVLGRNSASERDMPSWAPELDYENEMLSADVNGRMSAVETNDSDDKLASDSKNSNGKTSGNPSTKYSGKEARSKISNGSLARSKSDIMSRTKKPLSGGRSTFMKSKAEKEEENRKRMEEVMIQRQKRIAGRSSAGNGSVSSKRIPSGKVSTSSAKNEKPKVQSPSEETKKPVFRSSTIDRLATAARTTPKMPSTAPSRTAQPPKPNLKANGIAHKNAGADNKKSSSKSNTVKSDNHQKKDGTVAKTKKPADLAVASSGQPTDVIDGFKDIKELHSVASIEKNEESIISRNETLDDKGCNGDSLQTDTSAQLDYLKPDGAGLAAASPVPREDRRIPDYHTEDVFEIAINPMPESPSKTPNIYVSDIRENSPIPMSQALHPFMNSEIEISTPAPAELEPEPVHSRKKWNSDDSSPKAAKGFRKLLLFGKKSRTTAVN